MFEPQTSPTIGPLTYRPYNGLMDRLHQFNFRSAQLKQAKIPDYPAPNHYHPCANPMSSISPPKSILVKFDLPNNKFRPVTPIIEITRPKSGKYLSFPKSQHFPTNSNPLGPGQYETRSLIGSTSPSFSVPKSVYTQKQNETVPAPYQFDFKVNEPKVHSVTFKQPQTPQIKDDWSPGPASYNLRKQFHRRKIVAKKEDTSGEQFVQTIKTQMVGEQYRRKEDYIIDKVGYSLIKMSRRQIKYKDE
ncbi:Hypothetical_protein [Hexamita inflata]|uniref:Hypothetical_protein n=1 Tax=Hexamita inflata TaxID=28002 RepID=A0AA86NLR4_9EUKA|nr:Hypothetical protein HINF_LOCUS9463 [Hexamita inflata]CAI9953500.1 Hypothetical protein HINF_LOCUS41145 [Hexamita inflata]